LRALYLTLEQLGYRPRRHHRPLDQLTEAGALVIAEPEIDLTSQEWQALARWVERGNLLLLYSDSGHLFEPEEHPPGYLPTTPATAAPVQPVPAAAGAPTYVVRALYRVEVETWSPEREQEMFPGSGRRKAAPRLFSPRPVL